MIRTQIQLTEEQVPLVREAAAARVRSTRDRSDLREAAIAIAGRYRSGLRDLAKRHDHYLAADFSR
jgi:hypothetical protein